MVTLANSIARRMVHTLIFRRNCCCLAVENIWLKSWLMSLISLHQIFGKSVWTARQIAAVTLFSEQDCLSITESLLRMDCYRLWVYVRCKEGRLRVGKAVKALRTYAVNTTYSTT